MLLDKIKILVVFLSTVFSSPLHGPSLPALCPRPWGPSFLLPYFPGLSGPLPPTLSLPFFPWLSGAQVPFLQAYSVSFVVVLFLSPFLTYYRHTVHEKRSATLNLLPTCLYLKRGQSPGHRKIVAIGACPALVYSRSERGELLCRSTPLSF